MAEFTDIIKELILETGGLGIFIGMFLESSVVPVPSEFVLVSAGILGFSIFDITIYGALGSTAGAMVGYQIGKYGGRPFLERFGKYFFITPDKLSFVDNWFKRWGSYSVLVSRLIPFVPFKIFSIASGIARMDFLKFTVFTLIGSIPRSFILGSFGSIIYETQNILLIIAVLLLSGTLSIAIIKLWKKKK